MSGSESYKIQDTPNPLNPVLCRLEGMRLSFNISGKHYQCDLVLLAEGSFNIVYTIRTPSGVDPDVVIRIAKLNTAITPDQRKENHKKEIETAERLGREGICPKIFMNLVVLLPNEAKGRQQTHGMAIERYDCSLDDVQLCPILMRQVFVEGNGESLLVDLYARASATTRCSDTKPGNVVVRLPKGSAEQRSVLSLALIDIDPWFCEEEAASTYNQIDGRSPLERLDLALYNLGEKNLSESALLVAAMSLLVHVAVSALEYAFSERGFGFPYIEITLVLMRNWNKVHLMLQADAQQLEGRYISKQTDINTAILTHWSLANKKENVNFDLSDRNQLYMFLASMVVRRESRILRACTKQRRPNLYRNIIDLTRGDTREQYKSKLVALGKSESIEAWDAMVAAATVPISVIQCGIPSCMVHRDIGAGQGFGRIRRGKKENEGNSNEKGKKKKRKRTGGREMRRR